MQASQRNRPWIRGREKVSCVCAGCVSTVSRGTSMQASSRSDKAPVNELTFNESERVASGSPVARNWRKLKGVELCSTWGPDPPPHCLPHQENFFPPSMPRRRCPAFLTLFLFCNQSVAYPRCRPSIRTLTRRIEALGYEVFIIPRDIGWGDIPQEDWGIVVLIFIGDIDESCQLLLIVPLPRRHRQLTRSGVILGCYEDGYIS